VLAVVCEPGGHWFWWAFSVVCGQPSSFVGSCLHFWPVVVMGHSWVVVGIRCHVMVAIGGVVGLCLWLVEERSDVTGCDISVMFKLAHEITCTISCDFLAVYSQNSSVLVQPRQR